MFGDIFGSVLGFIGQQDTNSANQAINQSNLAFNEDQAGINRAWSAEQASKQMDFQERMANSQWQRGVQDMQAAGLSPMLAYMKGGNAAPSGAMGASSAASATSPIAMGNSVASGLAGANLMADTANKLATKELIGAQTGSLEAQVDKIKAEIPKINQETMNTEEQYHVLRATIKQLVASAHLMIEQGMTQVETQKQLKALVGKLVQETHLDNARETLHRLDIDAAMKFDNLGRDVGQVRPILDILKMFIPKGR